MWLQHSVRQIFDCRFSSNLDAGRWGMRMGNRSRGVQDIMASQVWLARVESGQSNWFFVTLAFFLFLHVIRGPASTWEITLFYRMINRCVFLFVSLWRSTIEISGVEQDAFIQSVKSLLKLEVECLPAVHRLCMLRNGMRGLQNSTPRKNLVRWINCLQMRVQKTHTSNPISPGDELRLGTRQIFAPAKYRQDKLCFFKASRYFWLIFVISATLTYTKGGSTRGRSTQSRTFANCLKAYLLNS